MIETEDYTFTRIQTAGSKLTPPLSLIVEWAYDPSSRLVNSAVVIDGLVYLYTPENVKTLSCYSEKDFCRIWEGREWVKSNPLLLVDRFLMYDGSEDDGSSEKEFFVLVDPATGIVSEERRDLPLCWRQALNSTRLFGIVENHERRGGRPIHLARIRCYTKDLSEIIWETEERERNIIDSLSATDQYLVAADDDSYREGYDANTGEHLWWTDPYRLGIYKNKEEFWDSGSGGDMVEHGVNKRLRFSLGMPVIYGDTVVTSMYGNHMVGVDARTGDARWINYLEYSNNLRYQAYGDHLYTQGGSYIEIHKLADGQLVERIEIDPGGLQALTGRKNISTEMCDFTVSETHVFGTQWGSRTFFSVEKSTGKIDWAFQAENEIHSGDRPYIHNGRIYFRTRGALFIFEGVDGYLG